MGRDDDFRDDEYWRYMNSGGDCGGGGFSGGSSGGIFKFVLIAIAVIIVLALLLGVGIPGAVWGFFGKIILVVGFFTLLSQLAK